MSFFSKTPSYLSFHPLLQTYLPNSTKKIQFHQELLVLFWKLCDFNKVSRLQAQLDGSSHEGTLLMNYWGPESKDSGSIRASPA